VRDGKLRARIPGVPGERPIFREPDGTFAVDDAYEGRYLSRSGKATWLFLYASGLFLDAKVRTH
jgi:hypothetical protein